MYFDAFFADFAAQFGQYVRCGRESREQHVPVAQFAAQFVFAFDDDRFHTPLREVQRRLHAGRSAAYDDRFLVDDSEAASEWDFSILLQSLDTNFGVIASTLRQSVIRVQEYELWELKKAYHLNYYATATGLLQGLLPLCLDALSLDGISVMPEVQFTVGPYMEKQMPFFQWRRET